MDKLPGTRDIWMDEAVPSFGAYSLAEGKERVRSFQGWEGTLQGLSDLECQPTGHNVCGRGGERHSRKKKKTVNN